MARKHNQRRDTIAYLSDTGRLYCPRCARKRKVSGDRWNGVNKFDFPSVTSDRCDDCGRSIDR